MLGAGFIKAFMGALVGGAVVWSLSMVVAEDRPSEQQAVRAAVLPSAITYQGRLDDASGPIDGLRDFRFVLFDSASAGNQVGPAVESTLTVTDGLFSAPLDFGANAFNGQARWIEVGVRSAAGQDPYEVLGARQSVTPAPYALYASAAGTIYHRTVLVRPLGTGTENGAALTAAMDAITTASANERWLLKLEPGLYDVGGGLITGKDFVDIEGSGRLGTVIRGNATGVLRAGANSEIRDLGVESINASAAVTANIALEIPKNNVLITRVNVVVAGGTATARGIVVSGTGTTVVDTDVTVNSPNAIYAFYTLIGSTNTTLRRVTITATGALTGGGNFTVNGVRLETSGVVTLEDVVSMANATLGAGNGAARGLDAVSTNVIIRGGRFVGSGGTDNTLGMTAANGMVIADGAEFWAVGTAGKNLAFEVRGPSQATSSVSNSRLFARGGAIDLGLEWAVPAAGATVRVVGNSFDADLPFGPGTALTFYRCLDNNVFSNANPNGAVYTTTCPQ